MLLHLKYGSTPFSNRVAIVSKVRDLQKRRGREMNIRSSLSRRLYIVSVIYIYLIFNIKLCKRIVISNLFHQDHPRSVFNFSLSNFNAKDAR